MLKSFVIVAIFIQLAVGQIDWNGNNWAFNCDWAENDLTNAKVPGEQCGGLCAQTSGCTHFTWTTFNGGTCWMKSGSVSKTDAFRTNDNSMVCGLLKDSNNGINWNGNNWAFSCDFPNKDLSNANVPGEKCGGLCAQTSGCTHFTWTTFNGGTCWMKSGSVSKNDAKFTNDPNMVCGLMTSDGNGGNNGGNNGGSPIGAVMYNVLATRHGANEVGACSLPSAQYSVNNPVALGNIPSLGNLKFREDLCGHILTINCGKGAMDIIVTNSNLGGGLDLYASTWSKATGNLPPGETQCSVQLTNKNIFTFNGFVCYHSTGETSNQYYRNVGLLNTGGRIVKSAQLKGQFGAHRGANPYFAFDGFADSNDVVTFNFEDGGSHNVPLRDCKDGSNKQYWS